MGLQKRLLGRITPSDTANTLVYAKPSGATFSITDIEVVNNTGGAIAFRLFFDYGTTYDATTAIYYDKSVAANDNFSRDNLEWTFGGPAGNLTFRSATGAALTIWVWGEEQT